MKMRFEDELFTLITTTQSRTFEEYGVYEDYQTEAKYFELLHKMNFDQMQSCRRRLLREGLRGYAWASTVETQWRVCHGGNEDDIE
jgi:hypothetical protein